jgi:hypothetical protein
MIHLDGLVLQDVFGGDATSTLTGVVVFDEDPINSDH